MLQHTIKIILRNATGDMIHYSVHLQQRKKIRKKKPKYLKLLRLKYITTITTDNTPGNTKEYPRKIL